MSTPVSSINGSTSSSSSTSATSSANNNQTLTQQDFLQIMVAQFEQQDPLDSGSDSGSSGTSDYVNELISMTNLSTMQNMSSEEMDQVAATLPGETLEINNNGQTADGVATSTNISNGTLYVTIGGVQYPASAITAVDQTPTEVSGAAAAAQLAASSASNGSGSSSSGNSSSSGSSGTGSTTPTTGTSG